MTLVWSDAFALLPNFNPHSREGSDVSSDIAITYGILYFNPHSREGSDLRHISAKPCAPKPISIHTPAKGVTVGKGRYASGWRDISIHTPAKGVTKRYFLGEWTTLYFNPHSREGSDISIANIDIQAR